MRKSREERAWERAIQDPRGPATTLEVRGARDVAWAAKRSSEARQKAREQCVAVVDVAPKNGFKAKPVTTLEVRRQLTTEQFAAVAVATLMGWWIP